LEESIKERKALFILDYLSTKTAPKPNKPLELKHLLFSYLLPSQLMPFSRLLKLKWI
jgi:hypothetical protein